MWESIPKHWLNLWVPQWGLPSRPTYMGNTHNCHMGTLHSCPSVIRSIPLLMIPRLNWFTVWRAKKMAYPYPNPWRIKSRVSYAVLSCFIAFSKQDFFFIFFTLRVLVSKHLVAIQGVFSRRLRVSWNTGRHESQCLGGFLLFWGQTNRVLSHGTAQYFLGVSCFFSDWAFYRFRSKIFFYKWRHFKNCYE